MVIAGKIIKEDGIIKRTVLSEKLLNNYYDLKELTLEFL